MILAHCAISDLAWLVRELPPIRTSTSTPRGGTRPTSSASSASSPPGQVLWASDSPYGRPLASALQSLRCALEAGLSHEQIAGVFGGQVERLLTGQDALDLGPAPGPEPAASTCCSSA